MHTRSTCILFISIFLQFVQCNMEMQNGNENFLVEQPEDSGTDWKKVDDPVDEIRHHDTSSLDEYFARNKKYKPNWHDLDTRPLPEWYDKAKIGIFLHWGVFSVPSYHSEWFWYYWKGESDPTIKKFMEDNYPPGFTYQEFAPMFKAEFFDPNRFANLFAKAGAKYVVLTSKHHEGYTLFPSKRSFSWNAVDVGPHRDLVGNLSKAVRNAGLKFGVYHSLYEWFNPIYLEDKASNFTSKNYVETKLWPDIKQLINDYQPSVLWSDGDWEANCTYWNATDLLAWLYNESPVKDEIVVNDRWGIGIPCHHGDFYNCQDRYNPGSLQNHKWENAFTLDRDSWGYKRNMSLADVLTTRQLLHQVISTVSCGGNALINIGPTKEGTIAPIFEERLLTLGEWLGINGEAIYGSSPWTHQNDSLNGDIWYTCTKKQYDARYPTAKPASGDVVAVYASFLDWPVKDRLYLRDITEYLKETPCHIELLGNEGIDLKWKVLTNRTGILLPHLETVKSKHAWTLRFTPLQ